MAKTSLAAVLDGADQPMELRRFPLPDLAPGEALIRVVCCTLCGSDLHTYLGRRTTPTPIVLGHEILGEIADFGPGKPVLDYAGQPLSAGDRVTFSIVASCGECFFCERHLPQKCEHLFKYGHERIRAGHALSGGLAEYCHLSTGTAIIQVPEEVPDLVASSLNCATATVAAALRVGQGCGDEAVLIYGAGMLGLTACAMAASQGAREVVVCDVDSTRLRIAPRFGATRCFPVKENDHDLERAVSELTAGRGVDLALDFSGAPAAIESALNLLRIGGRCVLVGSVFPTRPVAIPPERVVRRLLSIRGLHNYTPEDLASAVRFMSENHHRFPFADLVTDVFPLHHVENAFRHAEESRALRVAVVPRAITLALLVNWT